MPPSKVYSVAHAQRGTMLRVGSKRVSPAGTSKVGRRYCRRYWEASNSTILKSSLAVMTGMDVDRVLILGNGLYDHGHPIPRGLQVRSKASRRRFGMDKERSMGASSGESYLLSGFLANVQVTDLNAISNIPTCAVVSGKGMEEG